MNEGINQNIISEEERPTAKINEIRNNAVKPENINDEQRELIENQSEQIFGLKSQRDRYFNLIKASLPERASWTDDNGENVKHPFFRHFV